MTTATPLPAVQFGSRNQRQDAVQVADAAFAQGDLQTAERLCRGVLAQDMEHADAHALLLTVMLQQGRAVEAVALANRTLDHFRHLHRRNSTAFGLHLLHEHGFRPQGIVDVGAYFGEFTLLAHAAFPGTPALLVEPQANRRELLEAVADYLGGGVHIAQVLLGDAPREAVPFVQLDTPFGSTGSSIYPEISDHARTTLCLPMTTLDLLLADRPLPRCDLLKLDVQGAELDVLRGASHTLPQVEVLFLELSLHECNRGAPRFAEVVAELDRLGFAAWELLQLPRCHDEPQRQTDAIFVRRESPLWRRTPAAPAR